MNDLIENRCLNGATTKETNRTSGQSAAKAWSSLDRPPTISYSSLHPAKAIDLFEASYSVGSVNVVGKSLNAVGADVGDLEGFCF